MKRNICVITGSRSEYGILSPVMKAIENKEELCLTVLACGMHMQEEFGLTVEEIKKDGFLVTADVRVKESDISASFGQCVTDMSKVIDNLKNYPDFILVLGDRFEALAGAILGANKNIPVAHIHGGDKTRSGHIDESIRYAITKFSHLHFAATKQSALRLLRVGEEKWRIHSVGSPALDAILLEPFASCSQVEEILCLDFNKPIIIVLQHPISLEASKSGWQMEQTMCAIEQLGEQTVVIYPNSDNGCKEMIEVIERYRNTIGIQIHKNIAHHLYLGLLRVASVLVGNSSSGIIEAPCFHLPVVNIGSRNMGREHAENIIFVKHNKQEIINTIKMAINDHVFRAKVSKCINPYGDGQASKRIVKVLSEITIDKRLLHKQMVY